MEVAVDVKNAQTTEEIRGSVMVGKPLNVILERASQEYIPNGRSGMSMILRVVIDDTSIIF